MTMIVPAPATPTTAPPATAPSDAAAPVAPATPPQATPDAVPPAPAVESPAKEKLTPRFVELARREKRLAEEAKAVKESAAQAKAYEAARAKVKDDPFAALEVLGLDLDSLVAAAVKRDKPETVEDKVARIEAERKADKVAAEKAAADADAKAVQSQVDAVRREVHGFVTSKSDQYELVAAQRAHDQVFEVMAEHYSDTGRVLPVEQAAQMVEDFLLDRALELARSSKKLGAALAPKPPAPAVASPVAPPTTPANPWRTSPRATQSPTLTNQMGAAPAPPASPLVHSREEALARVASKYFGRK